MLQLRMLTFCAVAALLFTGAGLSNVQAQPDDWTDGEYYGTDVFEEDLSDIEWEPGQGYHQEEWYDPSDWFDTDEGIEYEDLDDVGIERTPSGYNYGYYGYDYDYDFYDADDWVQQNWFTDDAWFNDWYDNDGQDDDWF